MADQTPDPFEALIDGYLDATLTDAQHQQLFGRLESDRALLRRFAQITELDAICREHAGNQIEAELVRNQMLPIAQDPHGPAAAANLLQELVDFEAGLEDSVPLVDLTDQFKQQRLEEKRAQAERRRLAPRTATSNDLAIPQWVVYGGIAAVLAIAAAIVWPGKQEPDPPSVAGNNNDTQQPTPEPIAPRLVATLTNTQDATWAEDALAPGSHLRVGQRLNLTGGLAEITTNDGAVAVLEAPASIELIDSPNAIRLYSGRLIGICETESSKGFLVRTAHLDVTDLGTRFGVDASPGTTKLRVFEGEVLASRQQHADQALRLSAGESASATLSSPSITRIEHDTSQFAALLPRSIPLPGTGQGLAVGQADPNWQVIAIDGKPLNTPQPLRVSQVPDYYKTFANDPATSQFIVWKPARQPPVGGSIAYTFQTHVALPTHPEPTESRLVMRFMADNTLAEVVVNGKRFDVQENLFVNSYDHWVDFDMAVPLTPGVNTIEFEVLNYLPEGDPTAHDVGLRLTWRLQTRHTVFTPAP